MLGSSPSAAPNIINLDQGEHLQISGGIEVGYEKCVRIQKLNRA